MTLVFTSSQEHFGGGIDQSRFRTSATIFTVDISNQVDLKVGKERFSFKTSATSERICLGKMINKNAELFGGGTGVVLRQEVGDFVLVLA